MSAASHLRWFHKTEGFVWSIVQELGDVGQIRSAVPGEVRSTGQELAEQPIGVLIDESSLATCLFW
jgi:hypothetical protein